jgi:hypothetical protein
MAILSLDLEFEWDESKAESNFKKHRVSFLEASETFYDPLGLHIVDTKHSKNEPRSYWVGKSRRGRILTTWFTMRGTKVRLIGAAELRKFRRFYEASKDE